MIVMLYMHIWMSYLLSSKFVMILLDNWTCSSYEYLMFDKYSDLRELISESLNITETISFWAYWYEHKHLLRGSNTFKRNYLIFYTFAYLMWLSYFVLTIMFIWILDLVLKYLKSFWTSLSRTNSRWAGSSWLLITSGIYTVLWTSWT